MIQLQEMKKIPYGNCQVLNVHGELIFRCHDERASWYLSRGLAQVVSQDPADQLVIQLNFETKGKGNLGDEFYLSEKENRCVVCGCYDLLTKHHTIPRFYRRNFPLSLKSRNSFDILVLCIPCHSLYESYADRYRKELSKKYDVPFSGVGPRYDPILRKVRRAAVALHYHGPKMKPPQLERNLQIIRSYLGKETIVKDDLGILMQVNTDNRLHMDHGVALMQKVVDIEEFIFGWRSHFVQTMQPGFLPTGWDQYRPVKKE